VSAVFAFIAAEKTNYPISLLCRVLGVGRTSFHDWQRRPPAERALFDAFLTDKIKHIHAASRGTYGSPRVHAELRLEHGIRVGRKRVERLMGQAGLEGIPVPRKARTTVGVEGVRCAPDLVERDFSAIAPDRLWCADITYLPTWEGWLYLASVIDCFSRMIVGWCMRSHMRLELVERALEMGVARRRPGPGLIHHSDHGSQGGFKWWSQHSIERSCDGQAEGMGVGADGTASDAITGSTGGGAQGASSAVLASDRSWGEECGRRRGGGRVRGRWRPVVQGGWRDAAVCDPGSAVGALSVVRRAGGDRAAARPEVWGAGDRGSARPFAVHDLPRAAS
jgi:putative transposase